MPPEEHDDGDDADFDVRGSKKVKRMTSLCVSAYYQFAMPVCLMVDDGRSLFNTSMLRPKSLNLSDWSIRD